jgi:hypothetical protein
MERDTVADAAWWGKAAAVRQSGADKRPLPSITDRLTIITLVFALMYMVGPDHGD